MIDFENVSLEFNVSTYGQLEKITDTLSKFHPGSNGYIKEDDFINYEFCDFGKR